MSKQGKVDPNKITPTFNKVVVAIKSWPAQTTGGIFVSESAVVIRGELYVTEVIKSAIDGINKGDIIITSMYSGQHINTEGAKVKILSENDILMFKSKEQMEKDLSFEPETFTPGVNYMLTRKEIEKETTTKGGIILTKEVAQNAEKNDYVTKIVEVISIGKKKDIQGMDMDAYYNAVKIGDNIVTDTFVGIPMNQQDVDPNYEYSIMYVFDAIAIIEK